MKNLQEMKQNFITCKYTNETRFTSFTMKQQYNNKYKKTWTITKKVCQSLYYAIPKFLNFNALKNKKCWVL